MANVSLAVAMHGCATYEVSVTRADFLTGPEATDSRAAEPKMNFLSESRAPADVGIAASNAAAGRWPVWVVTLVTVIGAK